MEDVRVSNAREDIEEIFLSSAASLSTTDKVTGSWGDDLTVAGIINGGGWYFFSVGGSGTSREGTGMGAIGGDCGTGEKKFGDSALPNLSGCDPAG
jgi:hypothetical protein